MCTTTLVTPNDDTQKYFAVLLPVKNGSQKKKETAICRRGVPCTAVLTDMV